MTKSQFDEARKQTSSHLDTKNITHHMFYTPADAYWEAPLRGLFINAEPYGYQNDGRVEIKYEGLLGWLHDSGKTRTKTVRFSMAVVCAINDSLKQGVGRSAATLRAAYQKKDRLVETLARTAYFNVRPTSNQGKHQDAQSIIQSGNDTTSTFVCREMRALDPHLILVGGVLALHAFNAMWRLDPPVWFRSRRSLPNGCVIQSIAHPSRWGYDKTAATIEGLVAELRQLG